MMLKHPTAVEPIRRLNWSSDEALIEREWLVTNGLGGYASCTIGGVPTRSHHGWLVAALPAPLGRVILLAGVIERVFLPDGSSVQLGATATEDIHHPGHDAAHLREFRLEAGLPVWTYEVGPFQIQREIWMPHWLNTIVVRYRLLSGPSPLRIELSPLTHQRSYASGVDAPLPHPVDLHVRGGRVDVLWPGSGPRLHLEVRSSRVAFHSTEEIVETVFYPVEQDRGYSASGQLFIPGHFDFTQ